MPEPRTNWPALALMLVVAACCALLVHGLSAPPAPDVGWARPVPTLQPTPPIAVPPGSSLRADVPQVLNEGDGDVTIVHNVTLDNSRTCVLAVCP